MKKVICGVLIILLSLFSIAVAKQDKPIRVICNAKLADKPTKDGFAMITINCDDDVMIKKNTPLKTFVDKGVMIFDQTKK